MPQLIPIPQGATIGSAIPIPQGATIGNEAPNTGGVSGSWEPESPFSPSAISRTPTALGRSTRYLLGEGQGVANAVGGAVEGAGQMIRDLPANPTDIVGMVNSGRNLWNLAKGVWQTIAAPFKFETYADPEKFGSEVANAAMLADSLKAPIKAVSESTVSQMLRDSNLRANMDLAASAIRDSYHEGLKQTAQTAMNAADSHISRLVRGINSSDVADIRSRGLNKAGIDTKPFQGGLIEAEGIYRQIGQKMPGADMVADELKNLGDRITFEQAKQLRTDIGTARSYATGAQKAVLSKSYGDLTDAMRNRAEELDQSEQFDAYNKIHETLQKYRNDEVIGKLLTTDNSGNFFEILNNKSNQAKIARFQKDMEEYGMPNNLLRSSYPAIQRIHEYLQKPSANGYFGVFRNATQHPLVGLPTYLVARRFGGFIPGIIAAGKVAGGLDNLALRAAIEKMGGLPEITGNLGAAARVQPKGATIGEHLAAKGQKPPTVTSNPETDGQTLVDVRSALINQGYRPSEIASALKGIQGTDFNTIFREALHRLRGPQ